MRFVVLGAGAIGGVVGARLAAHGQAVMLVARGEHFAALRGGGLRIESPDEAATIDVPVVDHPAQINWTPDDVVLLTVKTHHAFSALRDLAAVAPADVSIVCMQNGVTSERIALRHFAHVYGVCVMCPATYLVPGVVQAWSLPTTGILDIGRYPAGADSRAEAIAAAFRSSTFSCVARHDIMRWKYGKLLMNLGNAVEAICGPRARSGPLTKRARGEGVACLEAARIDYVGEQEDTARRGDLLHMHPIAGQTRGGGSSWQSLQRGAGSIESDYLNGEIGRLGRLHGVPTPVNTLLQRIANQLARAGTPPGSMSCEELSALLPD